MPLRRAGRDQCDHRARNVTPRPTDQRADRTADRASASRTVFRRDCHGEFYSEPAGIGGRTTRSPAVMTAPPSRDRTAAGGRRKHSAGPSSPDRPRVAVVSARWPHLRQRHASDGIAAVGGRLHRKGLHCHSHTRRSPRGSVTSSGCRFAQCRGAVGMSAPGT